MNLLYSISVLQWFCNLSIHLLNIPAKKIFYRGLFQSYVSGRVQIAKTNVNKRKSCSATCNHCCVASSISVPRKIAKIDRLAFILDRDLRTIRVVPGPEVANFRAKTTWLTAATAPARAMFAVCCRLSTDNPTATGF